MSRKIALATGMALALSAGQLMAAKAVQSTAVTCADLNWSAEVLAANPDIGQACETVYEKDGKLYAKTSVEVVRVRGDRMTFRLLHTDGTKSESRSITLKPSWRATIEGRQYRASDLSRGQVLDVFLPEDRFALAIGEDEIYITEIIIIEEEVIEMPTTASPLFLLGLAGGSLLALGGMFSALRRRKV